MKFPSSRAEAQAILLSKRSLTIAAALVATGLLLAGSILLFNHFRTPAPVPELTLDAYPAVVPTLRFGMALDTLTLRDTVIRSGETLSDLLDAQGLRGQRLQTAISRADSVMDLTALRAGRTYSLLYGPQDTLAGYLVYQPSPFEYIKFDLGDEPTVERFAYPVDTEEARAAGVIESSLWNAMVGNGYSFGLADKMEDALQWAVDFHHLQPNDEFRLVYDQLLIKGEPVEVGNVKAAYYRAGSKEFYAIYYESEDGKIKGYFDPEGKPMKRGFLRAPLRYSRISSGFNLNRLHPILKYRRPHYGTDYAAPYGTPILAVGDGTVTHAAYTRGNGRYVKIRHDDTYQTQYLHMQGFAKGIRAGARVSQGDVIGYVGSTGLATGPHVCFRFWKNGKQVDHRSLNFPPAKPLEEGEMPAFKILSDRYLAELQLAVPAAPDTTGLSKP
ncbi:MAG: peptidoglycan DD-metalloendopeptidase family protein [Saprospiraceae bacterium]